MARQTWQALPVAVLLSTLTLSGCLGDDSLARQQAALEAHVLDLYERFDDAPFDPFGASDGDWVAIELVTLLHAATVDVRVELDAGAPDAAPGEAPTRCFQTWFDDVGGRLVTQGGDTVVDHDLATVGAPEGSDARAQDDVAGRTLHDMAAGVPHRFFVAVDDRAAWDDLRVEVEVDSAVPVYGRIVGSGDAECVLHVADYDENGPGARLGGTGAGVDLYRSWDLDAASFLGLAWHADVAYHIYVAYADRYAVAEFDSLNSASDEGAYGFVLDGPGRWGVYAPYLVGAQDTSLHVFVAEGYFGLPPTPRPADTY